MPEFSCCGIKFSGEPAYIEHREKIHGEKPEVKHTCCGIEFFTQEGYTEHRQKIHGEAKIAQRQGFFARLFKKR